MKKLLILLTCTVMLAGCGINSVTPEEVAALQPGDLVIWRYAKATDDNKSWMYTDRIETVEGDKVTFKTSVKESNDKRMDEIREFREETYETTLTDLKKFATEQPPDRKVIIEIQHSEAKP